MLGLLLLVPIVKAALGLGLLIVSGFLPNHRERLRRKARILIPLVIQMALGISLTSQPAYAAVPPAIHVVQKGDSLWSIAAETLAPTTERDPLAIEKEWRRLWQLNFDVIGPDPSKLTEGVKLRLDYHD